MRRKENESMSYFDVYAALLDEKGAKGRVKRAMLREVDPLRSLAVAVQAIEDENSAEITRIGPRARRRLAYWRKRAPRLRPERN
jgi:hypothetical protein